MKRIAVYIYELLLFTSNNKMTEKSTSVFSFCRGNSRHHSEHF